MKTKIPFTVIIAGVAIGISAILLIQVGFLQDRVVKLENQSNRLINFTDSQVQYDKNMVQWANEQVIPQLGYLTNKTDQLEKKIRP